MKYFLIIIALLFSMKLNTSEATSYTIRGLRPIYQTEGTTLFKVWYLDTRADITTRERILYELCGKGNPFPKCEVDENGK